MACQYCGELSTGPHPVARHLSYVCGYSHGYGPITPCTAVDKVQQCPYCKTRRLTPGTHIVPFSCGFQFGNGVRAESPCGHTVIAAISNPCGEIPLEAVNTVIQAAPDVCTCDLFMGGCICGVFKREQLRKNQEHVSG